MWVDKGSEFYNTSKKRKCKIDCRKWNSNQKRNNNKYLWSPKTCTCENAKYLESITDDLVIMYNEIIDVVLSDPTKKLCQ